MTLRMLSTASETYATVNSGNYPVAIGDLVNAVPPFLNKGYCDEQISGYSYVCDFRSDGYEFKALPLDETGPAFTMTTGGVLSEAGRAPGGGE